jgi:hypothetical protein
VFDTADEDLTAWLEDVPEPDWAEHPVYSQLQSAEERLRELIKLSPAARPTGELALMDPRELSAGARIDLLTILDEQSNWLEAVKARSLSEIENADSTKLGLSQEVVSLALNVPPRTAQNKLAAARTLVRELPNTLALLSNGRISGRHAQLITEASWALDSDVVAEFDAAVTERAAEQTVGQLRNTIRRTAIGLDPATAEQRHQRALVDRKVGFEPVDDGMVALPVLLGAIEGQLIYTRLTAAAKLLPALDIRSMDQKRADLLVDAVLTGLPHDGLPELQGRRPSIQIIVSADTLLEVDDQPADLTGYGPITAETARRLAADSSGTWRRLLTDPDTGQLLDISENRYRPSQRLRDFVSARDGVCAFRTCNQPGYRCEFEHIVPRLQGGKTCRCNGALACKRHNLCKIDTGWAYQLNPDGSFTWTADTGHTYLAHPPERWKRRTDKKELNQPPGPATVEEQHAREDSEYVELAERWQEQLRLAQESGDEAGIISIRNAIATANQQRQQQVAHRFASEDPPF